MKSSIDTMNIDIDNTTNLPAMTQFPTIDGDLFEGLGKNTFFIVLLFFVFVVYLFIFVSSPTTITSGNNSSQTSLLENVLLILFIILMALSVLKYFFNIDIKASLVDIFSKEPELEIEINKLKDSLIPDDDFSIDKGYNDEVFHISDNIYTYEDAKGICGAFGGRLANYFDIEKAYKKGGEWCGYGWSQDQMVFYPTQKKTYEKLKKEQRQNDCGRPGVNGGFIGNPNARFGVNCVGKKPTITPEEQDLMYEMRNVPQTEKEIRQERENKYWKKNINNIDVSPFNSNRWNM